MAKPVIFAVGVEELKRAGLQEAVEVWEDGQRASTGKGTFEWWYFDAHFEDHSTAVIVYATKPIINPAGKLKPNLSLTITRADGTKAVQFLYLPSDQFSASSEKCDLRLGPSWVKQTESGTGWIYSLHAAAAGLAADLTFTGLVPPWRPGAGKSYFGDRGHYFAWLPSIPYGMVEGTLTYDGKVHSVRGNGYHDHNWGNVALPAVMDHWYWGRAHVGDYTAIFVEQIALKKYGSTRMPVFLLARGDKILADDSRYLTMETRNFLHHSGGREYPRDVDFVWKRGEEQVRLELRQPQLIEGVSLLTGLPPIARMGVRLFTNPYYFRFNTAMNLRINLEGLQDSIQGQALYEIMMLR